MSIGSGRSTKAPSGRGGPARAIGQALPKALSDLGVPSRAATRRIAEAWAVATEGQWRGQAAPERIQGGVLFVAVTSSSLRQELAQFHAERLLAVLKTLLPEDPVVSLRFVPGGEGIGN